MAKGKHSEAEIIGALKKWGQERVKKCRFTISTESTLKNLSFRANMSGFCDERIHSGSRENLSDRFFHTFLSRIPHIQYFGGKNGGAGFSPTIHQFAH
jgi:hypothetical protein